MKKLLFIALIFPFCALFAQNTCCSATSNFANLASNTGFVDVHQLPKTANKMQAMGKWVEFETPDESTGRAYVVRINAKSNNYLFVFHEWWGLNENVLEEADKWARELGDVNIVALDLYDGKVATTREAAAELMQEADETRIRSIIEGATDFAGPHAEIATLGWCFGGGWSMQAALQLGDQAKGCIIYYGMPEKDPEKLEALNCKVLGIFAEKDQWINRKVVGEYEKAMRLEEKPFETHWFNAEHAFANPSNPIYNEEAAQLANEKTRNFLHTVFE